MDSLTQAALGAVIGDIGLQKKYGKKALLIGAAFGTLPDLDVIQNLFIDPVSQLDWHRSYSHSIFFSIIIAPIVYYLSKKDSKWAWTVFWILLTHTLLDCLTTWGTKLFWPFSNYAVAIQSMFIIDPLYTIWLLIPITLRLFNVKKTYFVTGIIISSIYAILGIFNQSIINNRWESYYQTQNISVKNINSKTTAFNNVLWATMAETDTHFLIGYSSILANTISPVYAIEKKQNWPQNLNQDPKIQTLIRITKSTYTLTHNEKQKIVTMHDWRFGQSEGWETGNGNAIFNYIIDYSTDPIQITTYSPRDISYNKVFKYYPQFLKGNFQIN